MRWRGDLKSPYGWITGQDGKTYIARPPSLSDNFRVHLGTADRSDVRIPVTFRFKEPESLNRLGQASEVRLVGPLPLNSSALIERLGETTEAPRSQSPTYGRASSPSPPSRPVGDAGVPGDSGVYAQAKRAQLIKRDLKEAERLLLHAIRIGDRRDSAVKDLASLYLQQNRHAEGVRLLEANRHIPRIHNVLVQAYQVSGRYQEAISLLESMVEKADQTRLPILWSQVLVCQARWKGLDVAEKVAQDLPRKFPRQEWTGKLVARVQAWRRREAEGDALEGFLLDEGIGALSVVANHALERCRFLGLEAATLQSGRFSNQDVRRVLGLARDVGRKRPRDLAQYYLTAAAVQRSLDEDEHAPGTREYLRSFFRFMGDATILEEDRMKSALVWYAESLRLTKEWHAEPLLVRYLKSWVEAAARILQGSPSDSTLRSTLTRLLDRFPAPGWFGRALSHLILASPSAADKLWTRIESDSDLLQVVRQAVPDLDDWPGWKKATQSAHDKAYREVKLLYKAPMESLDEGHCDALVDSPALPLELDREYVRQMLDVNREIADFFRQMAFEEQERLSNRVATACEELLSKIEEQPSPFALQAVAPWVEHVKKKAEDRFKEILSSARPVLGLSLPIDSFYPDQDGGIELQIQIANQAGCSPVSNLELHVAEEEHYFQLERESAALSQSLRGGNSATCQLPVRVTGRAVESKVFSLSATVSGRDRAGSVVQAGPTAFSIRLYPAGEFEQIENPYASYAGGTPVEDVQMFFGRQDLIDRLESVLTAGGQQSSSTLIYGQKRSGKSTVLRHLRRRLRFPILPLEFSLGDIVEGLSSASFLFRILQRLQDLLEDLAEKNPPVVDVPCYETFRTDPMVHFHGVMEVFLRACKRSSAWESCKPVLLVDEFSYLYGQIEAGRISDVFMKTWKALVERGYFRSVLVGQDFMPRFKQKFPNEFGVTRDERVTYLSNEHARQLIEEPTRIGGESRFREEAVKRICELTAGSPYYLQIFCNHLIDFMNERRAKYCTDADVERVKERLVRGVYALEADKFENLSSAGDESGEYRRRVERILKELAMKSRSGWCSAKTIGGLKAGERDEIIQDLVHRDILERRPHGDYYRIRVGLFQEWLEAR